MQSRAVVRLWQAALVASATFALCLVVLSFIHAPRLLEPGRQGFIGYSARAASYHGASANRIVWFEPESPLPALGVKVGDLVIDPPRGTLLAGEEVALTVVQAGVPRVVHVVAAPNPRLYAPVRVAVDLFLQAFVLCLGILIGLRRRNDAGALALATAFCLVSLPLLVMSLPAHPLNAVVLLAENWFGTLFLPLTSYFVLSFEGGYRSAARPWLLRGIAMYSALYVGCIIAVAPYYFGRPWIAPGPLFSLNIVFMGFGVLLCGACLLDTWSHANGERRARLRWFFVGVMLGLANLALVILDGLGAFGDSAAVFLRTAIAEDVLIAAGALILAYSILRQRVVDLGFAISRALVFAVFTAALLVCFGIVEWFADHVIRFQQRESSALLDGAIAVGLYLCFHRVRDWIERGVERVFFHEWHLREAALERFREKAAHFVDASALRRGLLEAADAFAGTEGSGLYRRVASGGYVRDDATLAALPESFLPDADLVVEMRTFHRPVFMSGAPRTHQPALALPMMRRAELEGFVLVGGKPGAAAFRPDEVEQLARVVREVGLDLSLLRAEETERRAQELATRNDVLTEQLQSLARSP